MTSYQIRPVSKDDLDEVVELCALHAAYEKADYDPTGKKEKLARLIFSDHPSLHVLVVQQGTRLIGYASLTKQCSTWDANHYIYMDCLYMREEARSQGIGAVFMDRIKELSRDLGCHLIQWQTPDFNVRAIQFYKRIGGRALQKERFFLDADS